MGDRSLVLDANILIRAVLGLPEQETKETYDSVSAIVQELPAPGYSRHEEVARLRIEKQDPDDWPVLACALALDCPIWTEDRHFLGVVRCRSRAYA